MFPIVSIDGPAASGKSSVSQKVAHHLGIMFVSSGELYRAVTWGALEAGVLTEKEISAFLLQVKISSEERDGKVIFLINGKNCMPHLSDEQVNKNISRFSRLPEFRTTLLNPLRELGNRFSLVMEGRDIGSVVFPHTPYKFYLSASEEERQKRRIKQGIVDAIADRDKLDASRNIAPLVIPQGAQVIDTTHLTLDEVVSQIFKLLKKQNFPVPISL